MGGFLQQMYGPKRILMVSAVPSILSWFLVALGSSSISILLMSRFIQPSNYSLRWAHKQFVLGSAQVWPLDFWLEMFSWCTQLQTATSGHLRWSRWKEKKILRRINKVEILIHSLQAKTLDALWCFLEWLCLIPWVLTRYILGNVDETWDSIFRYPGFVLHSLFLDF